MTLAPDRQSPSPYLRRGFDVSAEVVKARLYVTSLGVYQICINGPAVSDELLNPGWSTYDAAFWPRPMTSLRFSEGPNAISGALGDGWYRGAWVGCQRPL